MHLAERAGILLVVVAATLAAFALLRRKDELRTHLAFSVEHIAYSNCCNFFCAKPCVEAD